MPAEWQFNAAAKIIADAQLRIGLIHHPVDWLNSADRDIASRRISTDFHFWLHGHDHNAWVVPTSTHITIAAGAVGAGSTDEFGINLTRVEFKASRGTVHLHHHRTGGSSWVGAPVEVHAPDGRWDFELPTALRGTPCDGPIDRACRDRQLRCCRILEVRDGVAHGGRSQADERRVLGNIHPIVERAGLEATVAGNHSLQESVTFTGMLEGECKRAALANADLFVLPTRSENFGIAVAEALASGTPVVTTTAAPWAELVSYECGWWVAPDEAAITDALRAAMSLTPGQLSVLGQNGRKLAEERLSWNSIGSRWIEVYRWILWGGSAPDCVRE